MKFVLVGLVCLIVGILIGRALFRPKTFGNLRVDRSDPTDAPYLFLELSTDVANVVHQKYVTFMVRAEDFLSHE